MKITKNINFSELTKRVINVIIFGIGGAAFAKGVTLILNIIIARIITEEEYGIYSLMNNTLQTFTLFAGAGIGVTLTRYVAKHRDNNKELTGILIETLSKFNMITSAIIAIIMFVFADKLSNILSENTNITFYLRITAFSVFFTSVSLLWQCVLQGFEEFRKIAIIQIINNIIGFLLSLILTKIYKITGAVISLLILQVLNYIVMYMVSKKKAKTEKIEMKLKFDNVIKDAIFKNAFPAFLSGVFVLPLLWFTNVKFTKINGYTEFAFFSVCLQWLTIINYLPQQLNQVKPIYTQLYEDKKYEEFKKVIKRMLSISFIFSLIVSIIICSLNQFILATYGNSYKNAKISFIIMTLTSIFMTLQSQFGAIYQAIGKFWTCLLLNIIWAIFFIILFFAFINYGTLGYALTYLISYVMYLIISIIFFVCILKGVIKNEN